MELIEHLFQLVFRDTDTGILNSEQYPIIATLQRDSDRSLGTIIKDRILKKIRHGFR